MRNEHITDTRLYVCCPKSKRQYYKARIRNFYLEGILLSDDIHEADAVLHIQDGRSDPEVCQELSIARQRRIPVHTVDRNMMNRHLMALLLDNRLYDHQYSFENDRER